MSEAKIIKTVQALLAKANATDSEAEAASFAAKAAELLQKHNLDEAAVRAADETVAEPVDETYVREYHKLWERQLAHVVAELYFCKAYGRDFIYTAKNKRQYLLKGVAYAGKAHNRAIAVSMMAYLRGTVRRMGKVHVGKRDDYERGVAHRLCARVKDLMPQTVSVESGGLPALYGVELALVEEFLKGMNLNTRDSKVKVKDADSFAQGLRDGDDVGLDVQVPDSAGGRLMLGAAA